MKKLLILFSMIVLFAACEEKMVVIPEFVPPTTGKVILVEELTGVDCPNCPAGSERLAAILELFPDNVVVVGIHGGILTKPLESSKYDFRNPDAEALDQFFQPYIGKPSAYFNRVKYEEWGEIWGNPVSGQWQGYVEDELEKPQVMELTINKEYNPDTRVLNMTVNALPLEDLDGEFKVTIMLTESGIIDSQKDLSEIILEYEHKHVLRDVVTNFDGDAFATSLKKNTLASANYTYTIPVSEQGLWNEDHVEVVAFIANTEGESEEVLQAVQTHLKD